MKRVWNFITGNKTNKSEEVLRKLENFTRELNGLGTKDLNLREIQRFHVRFNVIVKRIEDGNIKWTSEECKKVNKALNEFVYNFHERGFMFSGDKDNHAGLKTYLEEFIKRFLSLDIDKLGDTAIGEYTKSFEDLGRSIKSLPTSKSSQRLQTKYELYSKQFHQRISSSRKSNRRSSRHSHGSSKHLPYVHETLTDSTESSKATLQDEQVAATCKTSRYGAWKTPTKSAYPNLGTSPDPHFATSSIPKMGHSTQTFYYENEKQPLQKIQQNPSALSTVSSQRQIERMQVDEPGVQSYGEAVKNSLRKHCSSYNYFDKEPSEEKANVDLSFLDSYKVRPADNFESSEYKGNGNKTVKNGEALYRSVHSISNNMEKEQREHNEDCREYTIEENTDETRQRKSRNGFQVEPPIQRRNTRTNQILSNLNLDNKSCYSGIYEAEHRSWEEAHSNLPDLLQREKESYEEKDFRNGKKSYSSLNETNYAYETKFEQKEERKRDYEEKQYCESFNEKEFGQSIGQRGSTKRPKEHLVENRAEDTFEETSAEPMQIIDVHQYFQDDFDFNTLNNLSDLEKIEKLYEYSRRFEPIVQTFQENKYSIEYFVIDEKMMRLIENLDKIKCYNDEATTERKVQVIHYIRNLHVTLDENAKDD